MSSPERPDFQHRLSKMADDNDHGRFWAMCVDELKNFLTQRGIPCSGKTIWVNYNKKLEKSSNYSTSQRKITDHPGFEPGNLTLVPIITCIIRSSYKNVMLLM